MKPRVKRAVTVALVSALVLFALPALGESQARIVRLSYLDGSVEIDRNTGQGFEKAITNMPITQGVKLSTGEDGEAEVEFENGSTVRLAPDTKISFDQLSLRGDGGKVNLLTMQEGTAYFDVKVKDEDEFRVVYGSRDVNVAKSAHFRAEVGDGRAQVAVFKGELQLQGADDEVKVKKNETLTLNLETGSEHQLAKGIDQGQYDWWDKEREDYHTQYAYKASQHGYANSPYAYGWSDLNYYGAFTNIPGFGYGWRPYGVSYGWDPFASGYWVWYPGWGYTWISPYPWGWMPYRYGSWRFFSGYGWAWVPGFWQQSYYTPRVVDPPPSYRPPRPPSNPRTTPVAVGNPVPIPPHTPGGRARQDDDRLGGRPGRADRTTPPARPAGSGSGVVPRPSVSPSSDAERPGRREVPVERDRGNPGTRTDGAVQRPEPRSTPRPMDTPRTERPAPRPMDTPRAERPAPVDRPAPAPAPRVSPPSSPSPQSFDGGGSRPMSVPSSPAPHSSSPSPSQSGRQPNPK